MRDILSTIIADKRHEVAALHVKTLRPAAERAPMPRDFVAALRPREEPSVALIAEIKRASPSKGLLAPNLDPMRVAEIYASNGAAVVSVVTDQAFFGGSLEILHRLRFEQDFPLPLLRKDFIIDEAQLFESRAVGADGVLLIAAAMPDDEQLAALHSLALELGMAPLVEVHNTQEIDRVLQLDGVRLIGINNRDLAGFRVDLTTSEQLRPLIPTGITVVAESGIRDNDDVKRMGRAGVHAVLVGESLVTAPDIAHKVRELSGFRVVAELRDAAKR